MVCLWLDNNLLYGIRIDWWSKVWFIHFFVLRYPKSLRSFIVACFCSSVVLLLPKIKLIWCQQVYQKTSELAMETFYTSRMPSTRWKSYITFSMIMFYFWIIELIKYFSLITINSLKVGKKLLLPKSWQDLVAKIEEGRTNMDEDTDEFASPE